MLNLNTNRTQQRELCQRCKCEITVADYDMGQCSQCGHELPQRPMPPVRTKLYALLQKRMPKLTTKKEAKRHTSKFQAFDIDEVMARHSELIRLAINRKYSVKALTGLVRAAEDAYQLARA